MRGGQLALLKSETGCSSPDPAYYIRLMAPGWGA